jgi:hypothetical protein
MKKIHREGLTYFVFSSFLGLEFVIHGFSTSLEGLDMGPAVWRGEGFGLARERYYRSVGITSRWVCFCEQIHGTVVSIASRGRRFYRGSDGMITRDKEVFLAILTADCVPLFFVDPGKQVVALAHAGWRGTLGGIGRVVVQEMRRRVGVVPGDLLVGIGPSIGPCCYKVSDGFARRAEEVFPGLITKRKGQWFFDLWRANMECLVSEGVREGNIEESGLCTYHNRELFFSYRRQGRRSGRMMAVIGIK